MQEQSRDMSPRLFVALLSVVTALFLILQITYVLRFPLIMDEFVDAEVVHLHATSIPFRDFVVIKSVLGYYTQVPALLAVADPWKAMLAVKLEMALLAAAVSVVAAVTLARDYSRFAAITALTLLFSMSTFNERCAELRSDMPTAAAGLIALLFLVRRRPVAAGVFCAISLMMSQKAAYYVIGSLVAIAAAWVVTRRREWIRFGALFGLSLTVAFAAYLAFWSVIAGPEVVLRSTFSAPATIAFKNIYSGIRQLFWLQTLGRNPLFYALSITAIGYLLTRGVRRRDALATLLGTYGATVFALCAWHRQPWPYFFVILIPTLFAVQVPLFDKLRRMLVEVRPVLRASALAALFVAGVLVPIATRLPATLARENGFQRSTFYLGEAILRDGGTYFAGVPMFYRYRQPLRSLMNTLGAYWLAYLEKMPEPELMKLIRQFDREPVRFIVLNYRVLRLPPAFRAYLQSTFAPYWGVIHIYAPKVRPGTFDLHFAGEYVVEAASGPVTVDGIPVRSGQRISLQKGRHLLASSGVIRLHLRPSGAERYRDPRYREPADLFPDVYTF